jgi:hypothetical protein
MRRNTTQENKQSYQLGGDHGPVIKNSPPAGKKSHTAQAERDCNNGDGNAGYCRRRRLGQGILFVNI